MSAHNNVIYDPTSDVVIVDLVDAQYTIRANSAACRNNGDAMRLLAGERANYRALEKQLCAEFRGWLRTGNLAFTDSANEAIDRAAVEEFVESESCTG